MPQIIIERQLYYNQNILLSQQSDLGRFRCIFDEQVATDCKTSMLGIPQHKEHIVWFASNRQDGATTFSLVRTKTVEMENNETGSPHKYLSVNLLHFSLFEIHP